MNALRNVRRSIAVIGSHDGDLAISLAAALPDAVVAGFGTDAQAVVTARRRAARQGVADRVTFEATPPGSVLGSGYHSFFENFPGHGDGRRSDRRTGPLRRRRTRPHHAGAARCDRRIV